MAGNRKPQGGMAPGVQTLSVQSVYGPSQQAVTVSAVGPGIFLIGNPPLRTITHKDFKLAGPTRGTVAGYFCHRDGRGDTERAAFANQRPTVRAAMPLRLGIPPTPKVGGVISPIRFW